MTIKIEQEAILRVLNTARSSLPYHPNHDDPRKPPSTGGSGETTHEPPSLPLCRVGDVSVVPSVLKPTGEKPSNHDFCPDLLSLDSDEEDCISLSSCSSASSCGGRGHERRVAFATPLVTEVKTRPRTAEEEKGLLFYSEKETSRYVSDMCRSC